MRPGAGNHMIGPGWQNPGGPEPPLDAADGSGYEE
jgi:hypothetical protein